jgi:sulfotransferase family protein
LLQRREAIPARKGRVKILYIAGAGRSGSTILSHILGQFDGCTAVGELWNIWRRGLVERRRCGCGIPVPECPFWKPVLERAFGSRLPFDPRRVVALGDRRLALRSLPEVAVRRVRDPDGEDDEYLGVVAQLYRTVFAYSGTSVLVDSSKSAIYATLLDGLAGCDVRIVHLVRDARASAYSWLRVKHLPDFGDERSMVSQTPATTARRWIKAQMLTEMLWGARTGRYLRLRYEDLIARPRAAVDGILEFAGLDANGSPFLDEELVRLQPTHSASGNPARFSSGDVELRPDDEWTRAMSAADKGQVTALTWPLLLRYGYSLRPAASPPPAA